MNAAQKKAALRREMAGLVCHNWQSMIGAFLALPELERAQSVLLFFGVGREPDTREVILELLRCGKTVALPRCLPGRGMEARVVTGLEQLCPGTYGIPEPELVCPVIERDKIDLILVPNLCCDKLGCRLGHGGGYYDRYLAGYAGMTVALCPEEWLQEAVPRDEFDVPVKLVLTQTRVWRGVNTPRRVPEGIAAAK